MQDITAWLQGAKDYSTGLQLYAKYGTSSFLKEVFANGPTPFNIQKLEAELTRLAPKPAPNPEVVATPKVEKLVPVKIDETPPLKREGFIPNDQYRYNRIKDNIKTKYKQLERNMWLLTEAKIDTQRHAIAKQILKLNDDLQANYHLVDYYDEHGVYPDEVVYVPVTELKQRLMVRISRAKKRLAAPKCRDKKATQQLLENLQNELEKLRGGSNE